MIAGLLIAITSGAAFAEVLKQLVSEWYATRSTKILKSMQGVELKLPLFGISMGTCIFLASGLGIFGFPLWLAYATAGPVTFLSAALVWRQLTSNLALLESGQPRAFELDFFS